MKNNWIFFTVFFQMLSLLIIIGVGYLAAKKKMMDAHTNQQISGMISNIFNPLLIVSSAVTSVGTIPMDQMVKVALIAVGMFVCFIILGMILTPFFAKDGLQKRLYQLMFVFSNLGFIGIPVISSVFGSQYIVYVTEFMLAYTVVIYSYGVAILEGKFSVKSLKKMINPGIISGLAAILIIVFEIPVPDFIRTAVVYLGEIASPFALVLVGFSVAQSDLKKIFCQPGLYVFSILKLLVIPLMMTPFLSLFQVDKTIGAVCTVIFGMPVGNLPLILANERGIDGSSYSSTIILSTILCVVTVPILVLILETGIFG